MGIRVRRRRRRSQPRGATPDHVDNPGSVAENPRVAPRARFLAGPARSAGSGAFDVDAARADFPALRQRVHGRPLVYLDNAATTQKPRAVLAALRRHYVRDNANVRRGVHLLGERATAAYEGARAAVAHFVGAANAGEIVFTRGATEALNLVAQSFGRAHVGAGDEVVVSEMEHHANIVPWQMLCRAVGATLRVAPVDARGVLDEAAFAALLGARTKIVALAHVSNALGTRNPIAALAVRARAHGAIVVVDGAQAVAHAPVDVAALGCDFYAFSGHKLYGPTGVGALWGRAALLAAMPPWQGGGEMVRSVGWDEVAYEPAPYRFEAGTPPIAAAVGLAAAIAYLEGFDRAALAAHERDLLAYAADGLATVPGLRMIGEAPDKIGGHSFVLAGVHPHDVAAVLDGEGVAVRAGHHCAQPILRRFGVGATVRASFGLYNRRADVDRLIAGLAVVRRTFDP
ncbi:MAG: SufS family cysteine desulfurase [Deltaproteobacteria bacterium]|nr:SufS family cysteine desulfurase [Deltaproteobacteria bacterium]